MVDEKQVGRAVRTAVMAVMMRGAQEDQSRPEIAGGMAALSQLLRSSDETIAKLIKAGEQILAEAKQSGQTDPMMAHLAASLERRVSHGAKDENPN